MTSKVFHARAGVYLRTLPILLKLPALGSFVERGAFLGAA